MSFAKAACVAALTALALAGCGGGDSAGQAAQDFLTAAGNLDSSGICATVSAEMKSGDPAGVSCKAAVDQEFAQSSDALTAANSRELQWERSGRTGTLEPRWCG